MSGTGIRPMTMSMRSWFVTYESGDATLATPPCIWKHRWFVPRGSLAYRQDTKVPPSSRPEHLVLVKERGRLGCARNKLVKRAITCCSLLIISRA